MTTKIRLNSYARILEFCKETIGKEPKAMEEGTGYIELTFEPSLTATEKQTLDNALPDMVKKLYKITVTED